MSRPWPSTFWGDSKLPNEVCPSTSPPLFIEDTGRLRASLTGWVQHNSLERDELKADRDPLLLLLEWSRVQAWDELSLMLFPFCPSNSMLANSAAPSDIFRPLLWCILWFCWCLHFSLFAGHSVHVVGSTSDSEELSWVCWCYSPKLETLDDFLMPRFLIKSFLAPAALTLQS